MKVPELKPVHPIHDKEFVTVPSKTWNGLCTTLNNIIDVLNAQSETLKTQNESIETCKTNISKLAKITEEIYEILE